MEKKPKDVDVFEQVLKLKDVKKVIVNETGVMVTLKEKDRAIEAKGPKDSVKLMEPEDKLRDITIGKIIADVKTKQEENNHEIGNFERNSSGSGRVAPRQRKHGKTPYRMSVLPKKRRKKKGMKKKEEKKVKVDKSIFGDDDDSDDDDSGKSKFAGYIIGDSKTTKSGNLNVLKKNADFDGSDRYIRQNPNAKDISDTVTVKIYSGPLRKKGSVSAVIFKENEDETENCIVVDSRVNYLVVEIDEKKWVEEGIEDACFIINHRTILKNWFTCKTSLVNYGKKGYVIFSYPLSTFSFGKGSTKINFKEFHIRIYTKYWTAEKKLNFAIINGQKMRNIYRKPGRNNVNLEIRREYHERVICNHPLVKKKKKKTKERVF